MKKIVPAAAPKPKSLAARPTTLSSRAASDYGQSTSDTTRSPSPKPAAVPSTAGMTKEEKAAEMARRREERKQVCAAIYYCQKGTDWSGGKLANSAIERAEKQGFRCGA